jgi:CRISPR-associated protein Cmr2
MVDHLEPADPNDALLSFFLGPVQPFIAGARTLRDLWTGSYLLAWLVFAAIRKVLEDTAVRQVLEIPEAQFVSPELHRNPLLWTIAKKGSPPAGITTPCLPNRFIAQIPAGINAHELAQKCEDACRGEWTKVCEQVHARLGKAIEAKLSHFQQAQIDDRTVDLLRVPWDHLWRDQVPTFFEVRTAVLFPGQLTHEHRQRLLHPDPQRPHTAWQAAMAILAGLADARKAVRHIPEYRPRGDVPQKCTLLGTYEQMGPAQLDESRAFWRIFAEHIRVGGERVRDGERLCAISLVKRFAWPAYLADELHQRVNELSYSDTATVAAKGWLSSASEAPEENWSGQWLHWRKRDQEKDEECPPRTWDWIQNRKHERGRPPAYYAILAADADRLGDKLLGRGGSGDEKRSRQVSGALTKFALTRVRGIVEKQLGELIYSGGDDTLALLPTETVVACAEAVRQGYTENWQSSFPGEEAATISAGIVVVHYKEDLRFALDLARRAETLAKGAGRDALALTVCRRSGEQTSTVLGWGQAQALQRLVNAFHDFSDRWTYKLRFLLPTFQGMPWESFVAELRRLLQRVEAPTREAREVFARQVLGLCEQYRAEMTDKGRKEPVRKWAISNVMADFVTLCQSASFLARGREEA